MALIDHTPEVSSLEALYAHQGRLERARLAPLTQTGYAYDWRAFRRWCESRALQPLPATPDTVALFAIDLLSRERKTSTVRRLLAGVAHVHRREGHAIDWTERLEDLMAGARRYRPEPLEQAKPLSIEDLRAISSYLALGNSDARLVRDRAIVLVGFASALRAASLCELQISDVEFATRGAILKIRREKNDQEGQGRMIGLPHGRHPETCPVLCLREWIGRRGAFAGPLFTHIRKNAGSTPGLTSSHINVIVQRCASRAGVDSSGISSHSMRAGLVTSAGEANCGEMAIAAQTGHRNLAMVRRYFRRRDVFRGNILSLLDL